MIINTEYNRLYVDFIMSLQICIKMTQIQVHVPVKKKYWNFHCAVNTIFTKWKNNLLLVFNRERQTLICNHNVIFCIFCTCIKNISLQQLCLSAPRIYIIELNKSFINEIVIFLVITLYPPFQSGLEDLTNSTTNQSLTEKFDMASSKDSIVSKSSLDSLSDRFSSSVSVESSVAVIFSWRK